MENSNGPAGCLTTIELLTLANVSRRQLDSYVKKGIVTPLQAAKTSYDKKQWTLEQMSLVRRVPDLVHEGMSLEDIAALADQGEDAVNLRLMQEYVYSQ